MALPELVAHRGYARAFPENTLAAVAGAMEAGARHVEIDVQLSAEGTPHLFHDRSLVRVCGRRGEIARLSDREIAELAAAERDRFGERFTSEPVPTLRAFCDLLARQPDMHAFVEVKPIAIERFGVERTLDAVERDLAPLVERTTIISFSLDLLFAARQRAAHRIGYIVERWEDRLSPACMRLAPEFLFCDVEKLPSNGPLDAGRAALALYEVVDPSLAVELGRRGAALVETFAIREMLAALRDMERGA